MIQKSMATLSCLVFCCVLYAQNGWVPPVSIPANANACDPTGWKLVLFDDFDGNQLDLSKWKTYTTWDGMNVWRNGVSVPKPDHPDWAGARKIYETALFKDDNVVVSNGTCKLLLKNDPNTSWHYVDSTKVDTITHSIYPDSTIVKNLSGGCINTPFKLSNGSPNHFNSGRFEARIKFPIFKGAWCAFWLWHGNTVNEIDIAEAWGGSSGWPYLGNRPHNTYNLHAWGPNPNTNPPEPNPYNLPYDADLSNRYPNQSWWNWMTGSRHHQEDWHTYTCEWDTASIKTYLDFSLVNTIWKYYQDRTITIWEYKSGVWWPHYFTYRVGSECNPNPGTWQITYGYPYNSNSESHLRLSNGFTHDQLGDVNGGIYTRGTMEIDYVKIWQKHPEQDGHTDICAYSGQIPSLTSDKLQVCSNGTTFTVNPAVPGGWWDFSSTLSVSGGSSNSITLYNNTGASYGNGYVRYHYAQSVPGCPIRYLQRLAFCTENPHHNPHGGNLMVLNTKSDNGFHMFQLFEATEYPALEDGTITKPLFEWDIDLIDPSKRTDSMHYKVYGQFVSIPYSISNQAAYNLAWKLKVTNVDGSVAYKEGLRTNNSPLSKQADSTVYYFDANITDPGNYEALVQKRVAQTMVSEEQSGDEAFLQNMIEKIKVEELEPYLIYDSSILASIRGNIELSLTKFSESKLYPNPASKSINIILSGAFEKGKQVEYKIYNTLGQTLQVGAVNNDIDISKIPAGNYIVELYQNNIHEHIKFVKE